MVRFWDEGALRTGKRTGYSIVSLSFAVSYGSRQMMHSLFAGNSFLGTVGR